MEVTGDVQVNKWDMIDGRGERGGQLRQVSWFSDNDREIQVAQDATI